jgi:trehalose synthase
VRPLARFEEVLAEDGWERSKRELEETAGRLRGRVVWHVNSTARGGGVAEMLGPLIGYARDGGVDARWVVIEGTPAFFAITKRLHNLLHSDPGDGGPLGDAERRLYEGVLRDNAVELAALVRGGDIVVLHDPQTAGLAPVMRRIGAHVVWRCHIGHEDLDSPCVVHGWAFLDRYLRDVDATVFSRAAYVPRSLAAGRVEIIAPSIDPFAVKNQDLSPGVVHAILSQAGIIDGPRPPDPPAFVREDGAPGRVDRGADIQRLGRVPQRALPLIVQVSRWDRLKDHIGVMRGFARLHAEGSVDAGLVLAGPSVRGVADDPDGPTVLGELIRAWRALPHQTRRRVQLVSLPTVDTDENAAMVNALQRHATIVVQKSLQEGFGLTVAEAMWKARPVVASAVGGIVDQVHDGRDGVLLDDPADPDALAAALGGLLLDPERASVLGAAARERVRHGLLTTRQLADEARLARSLLG